MMTAKKLIIMAYKNTLHRELRKRLFFEFKFPFPRSPYSRTVHSGTQFVLELLRFCTVLKSVLLFCLNILLEIKSK